MMSYRDDPLPPDAVDHVRNRRGGLAALAPWSDSPLWEIVLWFGLGGTMLAVGDSVDSHFWEWLGITFMAWGSAKLRRLIVWAYEQATGLDLSEDADERRSAPVAPSPLLVTPLAQANAGVLAVTLGIVGGLELGLDSGDSVSVPAGAALALCVAVVTVGVHMVVRGLAAWLRGDDLRHPNRPRRTPW